MEEGWKGERQEGTGRRRRGEKEKKREIPTLSGLAGSLEPVSEVTNEIEEEVPVRYTDHFITDLDKQGKSLRSLETKTLGNTGTELL